VRGKDWGVGSLGGTLSERDLCRLWGGGVVDLERQEGTVEYIAFPVKKNK